jgi:hypothetical protein
MTGFLVGLATGARAPAHEHSPRVLSPHVADTYSMKTFADFPRWRDLEGDAKIFEVFRYLVDERTGVYPMGLGAWEGSDVLYEFGFIRDPVKMLNVYSLGYCDMLGPTAAGIFEDMGIGKGRTVDLRSFPHVVAEVQSGGKWRYVDLDLRAVFRREDGTLASLEEARADASLWERPNGPFFFPIDDLSSTRDGYAKTTLEKRYGVNMGGHTMDFVLRRGETFTRWWKPQGDRWNHHESYHTNPSLRAILERAPRGPKPKHAGWSVHTRGNGRFVYAPDLGEGSPDFEDGVLHSSNVRLGPRGLTLGEGGEGFAVFEVRSPYVIVPLVGRLETADDDSEASVVLAEGEGIALSVSHDNGISWKDQGSPAGPLDLTPLVSGRYGYLLRVALRGKPGEAVLRSLAITTWVQVHPASLPALRKGRNAMRYMTGDHHGLATHVLEIRTNGSDREDFLKHLVEPPSDFDPARTTARARGPFVARVTAAAGMRIAWFSAGGNFATHRGDAARGTRNAMAWAVGEPRDFTEIYRADLPADQSHWHYNADVEVKLPAPSRTVFIRYTGDPAVNNLRIYAHCVEERPPPATPITITHAWSEKGVPRTFMVSMEGPGSYDVEAGDDPEDDWIEMAIPSSRARSK